MAKDKHPGACDLTCYTAYDPSRFVEIHNAIFENFDAAKTPDWRAEFAPKNDLEAALTDTTTIDLVQPIIETGTEYEKTSDE